MVSKKWTPEEIVVIQKYYAKKGVRYVYKLLEGRGPNAIMAKAAKLGIRFEGNSRPWHEWEKNYLRRNYKTKKTQSIARTLKRSIPAIIVAAKKLGLNDHAAAGWTEKEKNVLRKLYPDRKNSLADISKLINRTRSAILIQAQVIGIHRPPKDHMWTKEEHQYLVKHFKTKSYKEIAEDLGLTASAVGHHACRTGLQHRPKGRPWTDEEKEFIKLNYKKMPTREIAAKLNRSVDAIINLAGPLGISTGPSRIWSDQEKEFLTDNYKMISLKEIAQELNRTELAVMGAAVKLGLTTKRKK